MGSKVLKRSWKLCVIEFDSLTNSFLWNSSSSKAKSIKLELTKSIGVKKIVSILSKCFKSIFSEIKKVKKIKLGKANPPKRISVLSPKKILLNNA